MSAPVSLPAELPVVVGAGAAVPAGDPQTAGAFADVLGGALGGASGPARQRPAPNLPPAAGPGMPDNSGEVVASADGGGRDGADGLVPSALAEGDLGGADGVGSRPAGPRRSRPPAGLAAGAEGDAAASLPVNPAAVVGLLTAPPPPAVPAPGAPGPSSPAVDADTLRVGDAGSPPATLPTTRPGIPAPAPAVGSGRDQPAGPPEPTVGAVRATRPLHRGGDDPIETASEPGPDPAARTAASVATPAPLATTAPLPTTVPLPTAVPAVSTGPTAAHPSAPPPATVPPDAQPAVGAALARLRHKADGTSELTVSLHPAELGSVGITATVRDGLLTVTVACADHAAREAVTAALPTLRHDLAAAGFTGVDVSLGDRGPDTGGRPDPQPGRPGTPYPGQDTDPRPGDAPRLITVPTTTDRGLDRWL